MMYLISMPIHMWICNGGEIMLPWSTCGQAASFHERFRKGCSTQVARVASANQVAPFLGTILSLLNCLGKVLSKITYIDVSWNRGAAYFAKSIVNQSMFGVISLWNLPYLAPPVLVPSFLPKAMPGDATACHQDLEQSRCFPALVPVESGARILFW